MQINHIRNRALSILASGVTAISCMIIAVAPGTSSASPGPEQQAIVDPTALELHQTTTDTQLLDALRDELAPSSVSDVLASANRTTTTCSAPATHLAESYCWQSGDNAVTYWMPQGITSSADASSTGNVDGEQLLVVSWYDNGTNGQDRGVRLSFLDMSQTPPQYRHVLLVEPIGSPAEPSYRAVNIHAGGLAWYGDKLYVCATYGGMRVFDMKNILAVPASDPNKIGRQPDGSYASLNYAYVMPQTASYTPDSENLRYSAVSVDRTSSPHALTVSEYGNPGDGTRIARFNIDQAGTLLPDTDGVVRADWAYDVSIRSMQGVVSVNGTYYIHRSNSDDAKSDFVKWTPGNTATITAKALPIGTEDISYWESTNRLWSLTEYANSRYIFATQASSW